MEDNNNKSLELIENTQLDLLSHLSSDMIEMGDVIMLRLQLPKELMKQIIHFQAKMNLYHSVGAIRYLLKRGLLIETTINKDSILD